MAATQTPSLDAAIKQFVRLGVEDPVEIASKVRGLHGDDWLAAELLAHGDDLVAEMARREIGNIRRRAELALRPGDEFASAEMKIAKTWVPGVGWKKVGDVTAADLSAKASWYERFAKANLIRAVWCREVIGLMEGEGVKTLGRLKAALPPLPDDEAVGELS